jgi:uncharacterized protein (DUF305 family)
MTKRSRASLAAISAALVAAMLVALAISAAASGPATNPNAASFERSFLTETIDHHYMGVKMGRACMDKSRSRRLGDICTAIVVNQGEEIARMRDDFLLDWYGVEKHPALSAADRRDLRELRQLRGRAFDRTLSRMFIEHHETQIARSRACLNQAEHHELKHVCMDQIDTQATEIGQFRKVLRSSR